MSPKPLLTHVVDGAVVAAEEEEGAGGVVAVDGHHVLDLRPGGEDEEGRGCHLPPLCLSPRPPPTCQCLVTAFQTPILPVWLAAISWLPTKKTASTGTPRRKTPLGAGT